MPIDDPSTPTTLEKLYFVDDPATLARLVATRQARWVLPPDARGIVRCDRVRLTHVRLWLEGASVPEGGAVSVAMATRGSCREGVGARSYRFLSRPLERKFSYRVVRSDVATPDWMFGNGSYGCIEVDGLVDDGAEQVHFQPAPYAEWRVSVSGDELDLSGLTRVAVEFVSSVTPAR